MLTSFAGTIREKLRPARCNGRLAAFIIVFIGSATCHAQESLHSAYYEAGHKAFAAKQWDSARQLYENAYNAGVVAVGENDYRLWAAAFKVGGSWYNQGKYSSARDWYLKAYKLQYQRTEPEDRNATANTALKLAECHILLKEYE